MRTIIPALTRSVIPHLARRRQIRRLGAKRAILRVDPQDLEDLERFLRELRRRHARVA